MYVGLGELWYEWNDLETAENALRQGIALGQRGGDVKIWLLGYYYWILALFARGQDEQAWQRFAEAEQLSRQAHFQRGVNWLDLRRVRMQMMRGNHTALLDWARHCSLTPDGELDPRYEVEYAILAQALAVQGQPLQALNLLHRLAMRAEQTRHYGWLVSLLVWQARISGRLDRPVTTLDLLAHALELAEAANYQRTLLDEGPELEHLLRLLREAKLAGRQFAHSFSQRYLDLLLRAFACDPVYGQELKSTTGSLEPLSEREREILGLVASGLSNQDIASHLIISLNTVKTHLKNISAKLGTGNRTQAVARARSLQLL